MANTYTDQQVAEALAALEANGGALRPTARQLSIPAPTLQLWRDRALAVQEPAVRENSHDFAGMWGEVQALATARMKELIPKETDLRAVAVAAGIAADKHLDYTQGRKGMGTTVNAAGMVQVVIE